MIFFVGRVTITSTSSLSSSSSVSSSPTSFSPSSSPCQACTPCWPAFRLSNSVCRGARRCVRTSKGHCFARPCSCGSKRRTFRRLKSNLGCLHSSRTHPVPRPLTWTLAGARESAEPEACWPRLTAGCLSTSRLFCRHEPKETVLLPKATAKTRWQPSRTKRPIRTVWSEPPGRTRKVFRPTFLASTAGSCRKCSSRPVLAKAFSTRWRSTPIGDGAGNSSHLRDLRSFLKRSRQTSNDRAKKQT